MARESEANLIKMEQLEREVERKSEMIKRLLTNSEEVKVTGLSNFISSLPTFPRLSISVCPQQDFTGK